MALKYLAQALAVTAAIAVAPALAQSAPVSDEPSGQPDITLSCGVLAYGIDHYRDFMSAKIWTPARIVKWTVPAGGALLFFAATIEPNQISFSGVDPNATSASGSIDRLTGRFFYQYGDKGYSGTCVPAKPQF
jgi:hypothetical protein